MDNRIRMSLPTYHSIHSKYLTCTPPLGGEIKLVPQAEEKQKASPDVISRVPGDWEVWKIEREEGGNKVAFKSHHGTYLSME